MNFYAEQISPEKWGIYSDSTLLATVSSEIICRTVIANLSSGRRDLPARDVNALYSISADIKPPLSSSVEARFIQQEPPVTLPHASSSEASSSGMASFDALSSDTQSLEEQSGLLNEKQLEDALIKAQQASIEGMQKPQNSESLIQLPVTESSASARQTSTGRRSRVANVRAASEKTGRASGRNEKTSTSVL